MPQAELLFTVIIPAFNKPDGLRTCLEALQRQTLPSSRFEIIVVDDGSEPSLEPVVKAFDSLLPITYIRVQNAGPAAARNHGARLAKGRYLAFTDHDCAPSPGWLAALSEGCRLKPDRMLGGPKQNGLPDNLYSAAHQLASNFAEDWFRRSNGAAYFTTNNLTVPREAFLGSGGFNESFSFAQEDREFGARWRDAGFVMEWVPDAVVVHLHKLSLRTFMRQQFLYGTGAGDFHAARSEAPVRSGTRFEGLRFHFGLVLAPFSRSRDVRSPLLAALLVASQMAYLAGVLMRPRGSRRAFPALKRSQPADQ